MIHTDSSRDNSYEEPEPSMMPADQLAARITLFQGLIAAFADATTAAEVGAIVIDRGLSALGAYAGLLALIDPDGVACTVAHATGYTPAALSTWQHIPLDQPLPICDAIRTTSSVWIGNRELWAAQYPQLFEAQAASPTQALAALPLLVAGRVIGAIGLSFGLPQIFLETDRTFMIALARQAAQVIDRTRSVQAEQIARAVLEAELATRRQTEIELQARVRQQATIAQLGALALETSDRNGFLQSAAEMIATTLRVPLCKVLELELGSQVLVLRAGVGWQPGLIGNMVFSADAASQSGYTLHIREPVIVADLPSETRFVSPQLLIDHNVISGMSVIIGGTEQPYGVLSVHTTVSHIFTADDVWFLQAAANILAIAIRRMHADTERSGLLRQIEMENDRLVAIVQQMPAGVIIVEAPSGKLLLGNAQMERIWGRPIISLEGVADYTQYRGFHADKRPYTAEEWPIARSIRTGEIVVAEEIEVLRDDDSPGIIEVSSTPIRDRDGQTVAGVAIFVDVTERKARELESLDLERRLQDTQRLESLGVLAGGIAHDFNNILAIILGNASLTLVELPPESSARVMIEHIERAGQRAADLTRQMLAYAGKGRFVVMALNLNTLIEEINHLLYASISKRAILHYNLASSLPAIEADATQIRQVIMNLMVNASEAIGDRSGVITISTSVQWADHDYLTAMQQLTVPLPEGTYVSLEVSDTGMGMDAETRARIFEPFFTTKFTGRGLGLAAVLGIVRRHQGVLRVYSEPGRGSTFKILFPALSEPLAAQASSDLPVSSWQGQGTLLIVDDDPSVRSLLVRIVKKLGFSVLEAADGRIALELFREHAELIVCVLLDMTMPHMGGEETFRALRRMPTTVPVILMSGYTEEDIGGRFVGKGLAGFLHKPFSSANVRAKLQDVLAR